MGTVIGAAPRTRREPSGLCVVEIERRRGDGGRQEDHYVVRYLESLPAGTTYPAMADRYAEVAREVTKRTRDRPEIYVDATGLGGELVDLVRRAGDYRYIQTVYFNHGDQRLKKGRDVRLGKAWLVTRLQTLLQTHQLHLPRSPDAERLAEELIEYEVQVAPDANDRYAAYSAGLDEIPHLSTVRDDGVIYLDLITGGGLSFVWLHELGHLMMGHLARGSSHDVEFEADSFAISCLAHDLSRIRVEAASWAYVGVILLFLVFHILDIKRGGRESSSHPRAVRRLKRFLSTHEVKWHIASSIMHALEPNRSIALGTWINLEPRFDLGDAPGPDTFHQVILLA